MKLAVSRYQNAAIAESIMTPVGFTNGYPRFLKLKYTLLTNLRELAPPKEAMSLPRAQFEVAYRARLDAVPSVEDLLAPYDTGSGIVLLCYEDVRIPGQWCHRQIFAQWWFEKTGHVVPELENPTPVKLTRAQAQLRLEG